MATSILCQNYTNEIIICSVHLLLDQVSLSSINGRKIDIMEDRLTICQADV